MRLEPGNWITFYKLDGFSNPYFVIGTHDVFRNMQCCMLINNFEKQVTYASHLRTLGKKFLPDDCQIIKINKEEAKELLGMDKYNLILKKSREIILNNAEKNILGFTIDPSNWKEIVSFETLNQQIQNTLQNERNNENS